MTAQTPSTPESGRRRALDSEVNLVPMIDLMVCCISFLLITAVWSAWGRLHANAEARALPGPCGGECPAPRTLHVGTRGEEAFTLAWREGATVVRSLEVPRRVAAEGTRYPDLGAKVSEEWKASGAHRDAADPASDRAVVHCADQLPFSECIAMLDAVLVPRREPPAGGRATHAFAVTFASD